MDRPDRRLRVALAQIDVTLGAVDENARRHLALIEEARGAGAEVLVFPELSLSGYDLGSRGYEVALALPHPILTELAHAAGDMAVVVGFVEEGFAAQHFNSAAVLRRGQVAFVHRKLNLATYGAMEEGKHFSQGRYVETFALERPWVGACLLCSDLWNPALVHLAALHGATLLVAPTNSSLDEATGDYTKPERWDVFLRHYALIYGLPIVFVNRIGTEAGYRFWGGSRILDAEGQERARAGSDEEALLVADLSFEQVVKARYALPTVRDSNLGLIHREIDRLVRHLGVPARVRED